MDSLMKGVVFGKLFAQIQIISHIMLSKLSGEKEYQDEVRDLIKKLENLNFELDRSFLGLEEKDKVIVLDEKMQKLSVLDIECEEMIQRITDTTDIDLF